MTCDQVREAIDLYLAQRLAPAERDALERHVAGCEACAADLEASAAVIARVTELPRGLRPDRELWGGIAERIRPARSRWLPWLAAAGVLLAAALGLLLQAERQRLPPAAEIAGPGASYEAALRELEPALAEVALRAPAVASAVTRQLRTLNDAIEETGAALSRDPGNPYLKALALSAQRKKLELLRWAVALGMEG